MDDSNVRITLRKHRTPVNCKDNAKDKALRESLLSESTSGIVKGEEDESNTSLGDESFSSPENDLSNTAPLLSIVNENKKTSDGTLKSMETQERKDVNVILKDSLNGTTDTLYKVTKCSEKIEKAAPGIPDGGWGWMVVLASFIISMIADGISFSFGLLYIEFLDEFGASKSTTAWIGSLFIAVPLLSGPVMSALVDRYGCKSMTILGGLISTLGFILASISTSLEMMMITFGVISGLGLGLVYVTAVVSIAYWFDKKRNLACGLGACGTGFGTFVYAPITQYLIEEYGWRWTILLLSGTLLNLCVCGCVMRDPDWWIIEQKRQSCKDDSSTFTTNQNSELEHSRGKGQTPEKLANTELASLKENDCVADKNKYRSESLGDMPTYLTYTDKVSLTMLDNLVKSTSKDYEVEIKYPAFAISQKNCKKKELPKSQVEDNDPPVVTYPKKKMQRTHSDNDVVSEKPLDQYQLKNPRQGRVLRKSKSETKEEKELIKQDSKENRRDWLKKQLSVNHHYLNDLKMPITSISHRNAMLSIKGYKLKASSCPDIFKNSMVTIVEQEERWYDDYLGVISDMFNVQLFKKATFDLLCLGTIILFVWFIVPYFYLAEHMINLSIGYEDADGALMISVIGFTNTIGMVGLGYIGDLPRVSIGHLYAVCLILCGGTVLAIPFAAYHYMSLILVSAAFGLLFAASFTFTPSLLVQLVSLEDFTPAYGLVLLAQGIGHLIGPPLSGLIFDVTRSWELCFYLAGGFIIVAGLLISFIQPIRNYQRRRSIENEHSDSSSDMA